MDKNTWLNPEDFTIVFRCTNQKYAESFIKYGEIKFNTPQSWVQYENEGRGDKYEGTIAFFNSLDVHNAKRLNFKYIGLEDLIRVKYGSHTYLKRQSDMQLPCYCFYILKNDMFECPESDGFQTLETVIPATYFRDFSDNCSLEKINNLPEQERPAVIAIKDFRIFYNRIVNKLSSLGVNESEIIFTIVDYIDFEEYGRFTWWDIDFKFPYQLGVKNERFKDQSEARIIINTKNKQVLETLEKPIKIGCMKDIAQSTSTYFHEGMKLEIDVAIKKHD